MLKQKNLILTFLIFLLFTSVTANGKTRFKHHGYAQYGKHYHVMHTSKNYVEKGVASWYGPRFNKRRTSSGERFNMYRMTAAHKTLPLSTYVQVTNLRNGRHVIVKVNDRGPFVSNRLIDLSYAAARKLGMVGRGIARVSVKSI
jgi:rare lipoprotein A